MIVKDERQLTEAVLAETERAEGPRFREIVQALVRHLHDFAREVRLTEAEFDASLNIVARLGQLTAQPQRGPADGGQPGLSTLVCLMNNGTEEAPTSANLLGPFWRQGSPVMGNGDSIVRSPTEGPPLFFTGTVVDTAGSPVTGAEIDVWHASPVGLYENQDPDQAEWNLRGKFFTDERGVFAFRSVRPSGYPIPTTGPVGDLLAALTATRSGPPTSTPWFTSPATRRSRRRFTAMTIPCSAPTPNSASPARSSRATCATRRAGGPDVNEPWYTLDYTFVVEPGEAWLPTPPVTAKAEARMADSTLSIPNTCSIAYQFRLNCQMVHLTLRATGYPHEGALAQAGVARGLRAEVGFAVTDFNAAYPEYADTSAIDELRDREYSYLDERGHVYLDYTGAGLAARSQLTAHTARIGSGCFGNPHSENPTSSASTLLVEQAREAVLRHFNTTADDYAVIFTPNATGACRLVGESYPFRVGRRLVLTADNHNSVNGIREFARARGARVAYVPLTAGELRVNESDVLTALSRTRGSHPGLFAYPAQSNFSGVQHPLGWVRQAQQAGYDVLLDAAAYTPANRLDLSSVRPQFVAVSWYKVFGYPTGVGCLLVRRDALARLHRPWFSGGTIWGVSVQGDWHRMLDDEGAFEDGTVNFLSIPDVTTGLGWIDGIGIDLIHRRVSMLTGWLLDRLGRWSTTTARR